MTKCPDCEAEIQVDKEAKSGDITECQNCGAELEILSLNPLEVAILEEEK